MQGGSGGTEVMKKEEEEQKEGKAKNAEEARIFIDINTYFLNSKLHEVKIPLMLLPTAYSNA